MSECSCPGKIMLAGEYAVVDGGPAVLVAVNSRARAHISDQEQSLSPFLTSVEQVLAQEFGEASDEALAARRVVVDSSAFHHEATKLGLGSSAAATVVAVAAAIASPGQEVDPGLVHRLAARAHASAQENMGAKGSGADVAACCYGGYIRFQNTESGAQVQTLRWPTDLHLLFPWTGVTAPTAPLVAAVRELRKQALRAYENHCVAISTCAESLASATSGADAVAAIDAGGKALAALGNAAGVPLWLPIHSTMEELAREHQGALKPTGAGAGDLALAAFSQAHQAQAFRNRLADLGILCPPLVVDHQGVRLQA